MVSILTLLDQGWQIFLITRDINLRKNIFRDCKGTGTHSNTNNNLIKNFYRAFIIQVFIYPKFDS